VRAGDVSSRSRPQAQGELGMVQAQLGKDEAQLERRRAIQSYTDSSPAAPGAQPRQSQRRRSPRQGGDLGDTLDRHMKVASAGKLRAPISAVASSASRRAHREGRRRLVGARARHITRSRDLRRALCESNSAGCATRWRGGVRSSHAAGRTRRRGAAGLIDTRRSMTALSSSRAVRQ